MASPYRILGVRFPFLFGGTFIEGHRKRSAAIGEVLVFPFLFGGTFIEGVTRANAPKLPLLKFPFLFGGTFIEGTGG